MVVSALALGIERRNWELVALCLLLGVADVVAGLPPETLERLLDLLDLEVPPARTRSEAPPRGRRTR